MKGVIFNLPPSEGSYLVRRIGSLFSRSGAGGVERGGGLKWRKKRCEDFP